MRPGETVMTDFESIVEAFEAALQDAPPHSSSGSSKVSIRDFLPAEDDPLYMDVLQELIRIDMEFRFSESQPVSLEDYRSEFPQAFCSPERIEPLAFEEYRLTLQANHPAVAADYAVRYGIDVSHWPVAASLSPMSGRGSRHSSPGAPHGIPDCAARLAVGDDLLDFGIVGELGRGAFARVFLAEQRSLSDRLVVLKVSAARLKEAEKLAQLQHTNIVPIYSVHHVEDASVICMPYFGATTLRHLIDALATDAGRSTAGHDFLSTVNAFDDSTLASFRVKRRLPPLPAEPVADEDKRDGAREHTAAESPLDAMDFEHSVAWIARQLAEGLAHAHARGILHRDLKPANLLLTEHGQPMILDFNLSVEAAPETRDEAIVGGTVPYMSPEQIAAIDSFREIDGRSDVFSLGVVLFQMCTGRLPFPNVTVDGREAIDSREMIEQRWAIRPTIREHVPTISADMESIVLKCIHPDPEKRYSTVADLAEDLDRHLAGLPLRHAPNRSLRQRMTKWRRRHPQLTSATAVAIFAVTLLGGLLFAWSLREQAFLKTSANLKYNEFMQRVPLLQSDAIAAVLDPRLDGDPADAIRLALQPFALDGDATQWQQTETARALEPDQQVALARAVSELTFLQSRLQQSAPTEAAPFGLADTAVPTPAALPDSELSATEWRQYGDAVAALVDERWLDALQLVSPLSERRPGRFELELVRSFSLRTAGNPADTEQQFSISIALRPTAAVLYYERGVCRVQLQRYEDAVRDFDRFLELRQNSAAGHFMRGVAQRHSQRPEAALADLNRAIELGFAETRVYFVRAEIHDELGDATSAAADRETGMTLEPTDPRSWVSRAEFKLKDNDPTGALSDIENALRLDPACHEAFRNKATVLSEYLKRPPEAIETLTQAMELFPNDPYLWGGRGVLFARNGDRESAIADAEHAVQLSNEPMIQYQAACIYALTSAQEPADRQLCFRHLAHSFRGDSSLTRIAWADPDLDPIRQVPEFKQLIAATQILAGPKP